MIVAFDFDGTLCDSMGALEDLAVSVIRRHWDVADEAVLRRRYRETSGDPFDLQLPRMVNSSGREVALAAADYAAEKADVTMRSAPVHATMTAVELLVRAGAHVHVISSTESTLIRRWITEHLTFPGEVLVHGIDMGTKLDNLRRCAPDWFIGDSVSDWERAELAGVRFCHVDDVGTWIEGVLS